MRRIAPLALVLVLAPVVVASAQPSSGTVFISAGGFAAIERGPTSRGLGVPNADRNGTVAGGSLGLGIHLTERVTARVEWSLTDGLKRADDIGVYPLAGIEASLFFPPSGPSLTSIVSTDVQHTTTTSAGFALLGYHVPAGRATIELVGGVGILNTDIETRYSTRQGRGFGSIFPPMPEARFSSSSYHAVAVIGTSLPVALTSHASVVPEVRAYATGGGLSLRPGLGLRWTF